MTHRYSITFCIHPVGGINERIKPVEIESGIINISNPIRQGEEMDFKEFGYLRRIDRVRHFPKEGYSTAIIDENVELNGTFSTDEETFNEVVRNRKNLLEKLSGAQNKVKIKTNLKY